MLSGSAWLCRKWVGFDRDHLGSGKKSVLPPPTPNEFKEGNETNNNLNDIRNVFYYHQEDK